jgi:hypothetical protein
MSKAKQPIKQRNFVAKYNKHRAVVMRDHTKYTRKDKHKGGARCFGLQLGL